MRNTILLLLASLFLCSTAGAQSGVVQPNATKNIQQSQSSVVKLTNQDVRELVKAGLSPAETIAKIESSASDFDVSSGELEKLKGFGVSDVVIGAMVQAMKAGQIDQTTSSSQPEKTKTLVIPAGTSIDVEAAYSVSSLDLKAGDLLSFRVLIPVIIDSATAIEKGALVTARVIESKRGGHWGKAGRLSWEMQDVIAIDGTRIAVHPESTAGGAPGKTNSGDRPGKTVNSANRVTGTSHGAEIATKAIIAGAIFPPLAPLGLMQGFRRGENAVLPRGKRSVVFVRGEASVKVVASP